MVANDLVKQSGKGRESMEDTENFIITNVYFMITLS